MESNDYWTHVGLAAAFFVLVAGPRLFSPGHTANSVTYVVGATVVVLVATFARYRTQAASDLTSPARRLGSRGEAVSIQTRYFAARAAPSPAPARGEWEQKTGLIAAGSAVPGPTVCQQQRSKGMTRPIISLTRSGT